jgi:alpha-tubulin suppressor-like RCC1 family protein
MYRKMQFYQRMLLIVVACSGLIAAPQAFAYKQIAAGGYHTCGLKNDGSVTCWGAGTTNAGDESEYQHGQSIAPSGTFTQISAGGSHTCGLKSDGSAVCWGLNVNGQTTIPSGMFTQLSAGLYHTCGLKSEGSAVCWGNDTGGQTTTIPSGTFTQLSVGGFHSCGLKSDGGAICWGLNVSGQTTIPSGMFTQLSAGGSHTCGLKSDGSAICWGDDYDGQIKAPSDTFTQISAGARHTCGLKSDGSAVCWGNNMNGQTTIPSGTFTQIIAGGDHNCGLKSDGSAVCWGDNTFGQTTVPVDNSGTSPVATLGRIKGISTRAPVRATAEKYMMAGVYVRGTTQKQVLIRATGKGLMKEKEVNTTLDANLDANLEVYQLATSTTVPVDKNDNWKSHSSYSAVQAVGGALDDSDAALVTNLNSGYYSMVVMPSGGSMTSSGGSTEGIGLIEVYDNDHSSTSRLSGISTRSYVGAYSYEYMYAGLKIEGNVKLLIRALGNGLIARGVAGALDDTSITVRGLNGEMVDRNDNWQTHSSSSMLTQSGLAPTDSSDAAMITNLTEGLYTIEVKSAKGGQGVALVEVYEIVN